MTLAPLTSSWPTLPIEFCRMHSFVRTYRTSSSSWHFLRSSSFLCVSLWWFHTSGSLAVLHFWNLLTKQCAQLWPIRICCEIYDCRLETTDLVWHDVVLDTRTHVLSRTRYGTSILNMMVNCKSVKSWIAIYFGEGLKGRGIQSRCCRIWSSHIVALAWTSWPKRLMLPAKRRRNWATWNALKRSRANQLWLSCFVKVLNLELDMLSHRLSHCWSSLFWTRRLLRE